MCPCLLAASLLPSLDSPRSHHGSASTGAHFTCTSEVLSAHLSPPFLTSGCLLTQFVWTSPYLLLGGNWTLAGELWI